MKVNIKQLLFYILITLGIGALPTLFVNFDKYKDFNKPPLSPPGIVFPIVWTILFILMGISIYRIVRTKNFGVDSLKILYFAQLIVNALWTPIFFGLNAFLFAFIWLLLLLVLVIIMTVKFHYLDKISAYLLIPYIIWLVFAGYLNFGVYLLN
jgi:tryptophan-rich sensory protein